MTELQGLTEGIWISLVYIGGFAAMYFCCIRPDKPSQGKTWSLTWTCLLVLGLGIRVLTALFIEGHPTDMSCWFGWSEIASWPGLFHIYNSGVFVDYPPGYMYVLGPLGNLRQLMGIEVGSLFHGILVKMPSMVADVLAAVILFRFARSRFSPQASMGIACLYLFHPAVVFNSSGWGQVDGILALLVLAYSCSLYHRKIVQASAWFALGLLFKPQMLLFGPLLLVVFVKHLAEKGPREAGRTFLKGFGLGAGIFLAGILPFQLNMPWYWIFSLYVSTMSSYDFINLNSANLYMLLGWNWIPNSSRRFGVSLGAMGYAGLSLSVLLYMGLDLFHRKRDMVFLGGALLMTGIFTLAPKMHERYLFPALILLLFAYLVSQKSQILYLYLLLGVSHFLNIFLVLFNPFLPPEAPAVWIVSLLTLVGYIWTAVIFAVYAFKRKEALHNNPVIESNP